MHRQALVVELFEADFEWFAVVSAECIQVLVEQVCIVVEFVGWLRALAVDKEPADMFLVLLLLGVAVEAVVNTFHRLLFVVLEEVVDIVRQKLKTIFEKSLMHTCSVWTISTYLVEVDKEEEDVFQLPTEDKEVDRVAVAL